MIIAINKFGFNRRETGFQSNAIKRSGLSLTEILAQSRALRHGFFKEVKTGMNSKEYGGYNQPCNERVRKEFQKEGTMW
jgi:hypothetical protein